ncbi:uncharacterized protein LOC124425461 isoform X2 [Vespa crabro]|uniref:uncharacterized protein LOC124425461 isoform X2 n=1 Tax=Vespa crabro TaxID=7445 RepID=UPI001EFFEAC3|nr:uncharacterized protein LOC124425461 isoform X2 [Vespa crabro]
MLEIFALCSCACLACLWCAIALELMPILPCKVCCRVKNRCECAKTNENVPTFDVTIHNCSCPNLNCQGQQQQQQHYNGSPIRLSYYSMTFDPCQQMPISNINNIPHISNIPKVFKNNIPNVLNIPNISNIPNMTNISNVPNIWKDYTQYYKQIPANFKRKRYFPRKLKGQRNYL